VNSSPPTASLYGLCGLNEHEFKFAVTADIYPTSVPVYIAITLPYLFFADPTTHNLLLSDVQSIDFAPA
jgi:hypothetical protein